MEQQKCMRFWGQTSWVSLLQPLFPDCVTMGKLLILSVPQYFFLSKNGAVGIMFDVMAR